MGLQLETAGRGTLAVYTSVFPPCSHHLNHRCLDCDFSTGYLRRFVRACHLPYDAFSSLHHWGIDHHELVYIYYRNLASITFRLSSAHVPIAYKEEDRYQDCEDYRRAVSGARFHPRPR